jgi:peptidoglycan/LPS O-acetylase OafA/YrhL
LFRRELVAPLFLLIAVGAITAHIVNHLQPFMSGHWLCLFSMFFRGATCYLYRDQINLSVMRLGLLLAALLLSSRQTELFFAAYAVFLPYLVIHLAYLPAGGIRSFNRVGDYSYGLYIYAFPVRQSVLAIFPTLSLLRLTLVSFGVTMVLAVISWHLLEKTCMEKKDRYVVFERGLRTLRLSLRST